GYFPVKPFPADHLIGSLGYKCPVPGTPAFVALQRFFHYLVCIFPLVEDKVGSIYNGKYEVPVQAHGLILGRKGIALVWIGMIVSMKYASNNHKKKGSC